MPSITSQIFVLALKMQVVKLPADLPIEKMREAAQRAPRMWMPAGVRVEPVNADGVPSEWLIPQNAAAGRAILYLHGGEYCLATPNLHRPMIARLALAARARALMINYRLAPENPFPAGLDDTLAAWHWLVGNGYAPGQILVAGDSAGGALALALGLLLRDAHESLPAAIAGLSTCGDLSAGVEELRARRRSEPPEIAEILWKLGRAYIGNHDPRNPLISPVYADLRGLPPLLIQTGSNEIFLDDNNRRSEEHT